MKNDKDGLGANLSPDLDVLMELASLSPSTAILAANVLMRSPRQSFRENGASLGLAVVAGDGSGFGKEEVAFAANMLSENKETAMAFVLAAPSAALRLSNELLMILDADRCMEIEALLPGFASSSRAESLARRPRLVGMLSAAGQISPQLRRSVMSEAARAFAQAQAERAREKAPAATRGAKKKRGAEGFVGEDSFTQVVSSICPEWEKQCWIDFWSVELRESLAQDSTSLWLEWQALPSAFNPFSVAPPPESLTAGQKDLAMSWCKAFAQHALPLPCAGRARDLGRYLASAPEGWTPWREREAKAPLRLLGDGGPFPALTACNASAEALTMMAPQISLSTNSSNFLSEKTKCWLALAEGLIEGGAQSPKFKMRDHGENCIKNIFPSDMPLALVLLFVLGVAAPIKEACSDAFFSWIAEGSDSREAGRLRKLGASWQPSRASSPVNLDEQQMKSLAASLIMLERCEIASAAKCSTTKKSSRQIRL